LTISPATNRPIGAVNPAGRCAVRAATSSAGQAAIDRHLAAHPELSGETFQIKDDDERDAALVAGRFSHALFADLDALLDTIWSHHADLHGWQAAGVTIVLAIEPAAADWRDLVRAAHDSFKRHRARQSRRQTIAATILSLVAVAAVGALFILR
jgi:hypothetical protein